MAFTEQPLHGLGDVLDQSLVDNFNHGRAEEIIQPLADLGYLKISEVEGEIADLDAIKAAIKSFRNDAIHEQLLSESDVADAIDQAEVIPDLILSPQELKVLHVLTSIEGDFNFSPHLLEINVTNLYSRVLHYRMELFGLWNYKDTELPFSHATQNNLKRLARWLELDALAEVYALLGNLPKMVARIRNTGLFQRSMIVFEYSPARFNPTHFQHTHPFQQKLKQTYGRKSEVLDHFKTHVRKPRTPDLQALRQAQLAAYNYFLLRIVQLAQWVSGYYMGKLDSDLKELTFESLNEMVRTEVEFGNTDFQLQLLVYYVKDGMWLLNTKYLFDEVIKDSLYDEVGEVEIAEIFHQFENQYERAETKGDTEMKNDLRQAWKEVNKEASANLKSKQGFTRRIYYGFKSFFKRIKRGIRKIFANIKAFIEKAKNLFKNITKKLFSEIREGLRLFRQGYRYLFGKREIISADQKIITKFSFDSDGLSMLKKNVATAHMQKHEKRIYYYGESLMFSLTLTGKVIHYVATAILTGGMSLLIKMALTLKEMIKEKLFEKHNLQMSFVNIAV